ncbi:fruit bromelain-like [Vicia villosa]|uniref:fruit bromelain-like n=1 Tax=Vicia villosa TaxID=3911 RepID=UPI00273BEB61|nr:fruit bromelain-like [Vicia villosa]
MENQLQILKEGLEYIEKFNKVGNKSYTISLNQSSDLTIEEFIASYTGFKASHKDSYSNAISNAVVFNIRGCRAFAAVAAVEAFITCYEFLQPNYEQNLLRGVIEQPVAVNVVAGDEFKKYTRGLYKGTCGTEINHSIVIGCYGVSQEGVKCWIIKNSWSKAWGEIGYIRIKREGDGPEGHCNIATRLVIPCIDG